MNDSLQLFEIKLDNCAFYAYHGAFDEEKKLGQRFFVDAGLQVRPGGDLQNDRLGDTVHYGEVFATIERIVTKTNRDLIEALALDVAKALCDQFPKIVQAKITIRKPNAPVDGIFDFVQVTVCYPPDAAVADLLAASGSDQSGDN